MELSKLEGGGRPFPGGLAEARASGWISASRMGPDGAGQRVPSAAGAVVRMEARVDAAGRGRGKVTVLTPQPTREQARSRLHSALFGAGREVS